MGQKTTAQALREHLMAPRALELEVAPACAVAEELEAFTARGIPYYAPHEPEYREWVAKAVSYWEKLHTDAEAHPPVPCMSVAKVRGGRKGRQRMD
jgi:hypothetical protein